METLLINPNVTFSSMPEALAFVEKTNETVDFVKNRRSVSKDFIIISLAVIGVSILGYGLFVHFKEKKQYNNIQKK